MEDGKKLLKNCILQSNIENPKQCTNGLAVLLSFQNVI